MFYPITHELTKHNPKQYSLRVFTECANDTIAGSKLVFDFQVYHDVSLNKQWWAKQIIGSWPVEFYRESDRSLNPLIEGLCSACYSLVNTQDPTHYIDWQFNVNSGGFYCARFVRRGWTCSAYKNPRDTVHNQWLVRAMREGATIQAESSLISNACIDIDNHIRQFVTLGEFKNGNPSHD